MNLRALTHIVVDFVRANREFAPIVLALLTSGSHWPSSL